MKDLPAKLGCLVCEEKGKFVIHMAYSMYLDDTSKWYWVFMDHAGKDIFTWPNSFSSKEEAASHLTGILDEAQNEG